MEKMEIGGKFENLSTDGLPVEKCISIGSSVM